MIRSLIAMYVSLAVGPAAAATLPVPPVPPTASPRDEAAPVPDSNLRPPVSAASDDLRVGLRMYTVTLPDTSLAFAPGSRYQSYEERKPTHMPGLRVVVPLQ
jgi:hypothetical protein